MTQELEARIAELEKIVAKQAVDLDDFYRHLKTLYQAYHKMRAGKPKSELDEEIFGIVTSKIEAAVKKSIERKEELKKVKISRTLQPPPLAKPDILMDIIAANKDAPASDLRIALGLDEQKLLNLKSLLKR